MSEEADVVDAGHWTALSVAEAVIEAFRTLPDIPIYSPRRAEFIPANPRHDGAGFDVIAWSERILGRASDERRALLVWGRAMARCRIRQDRRLRLVRSVPGGSVSDHCREVGICRRTFDRRRIRACERIAAELNWTGDDASAALADLRSATPSLARQVDRLKAALTLGDSSAGRREKPQHDRSTPLPYSDRNA